MLLALLLTLSPAKVFDLRDLQLDWAFSATRSVGEYGNESDFFSLGSVRSATMRANNSIRFLIKGGIGIENRCLHINITDNQIEVFDEALDLVTVLDSTSIDASTVFIRGRTLDGEYIVSGTLDRHRQSILTISATQSDDVMMIRGSPPKAMEAKDVAARLAPAIGIIFFMGFGRMFRARFWNQFSHMNTRSLQNRINELKQQGK
jgi:hypothetical protein